MKNKNTFRKWMALFLSISMVAASGITSNVRLRAAEDTPVQETTAEETTSADTDASATENAGETTVANVDQNDTTRTEEIGLNGTEQAAEESAAPAEEENKNAETAAEAEQGATPATVADSENKETVADSTASSSSSSSEDEDKNLTASEQIDEARKDATKREYSYEDDLVSVTATLDDPKAIPDNAEFRVTPVTKDSTDYNYDAYMNALNDDAAASSDSDAEKQYTDENTLLYDMAFIYPVEEKDEDGNVTQKEVEVQPAEGAVKISVNFKKDQLTKSLDADKDSDVEIKHLPLTDAVKESNDTTADATNISADDVKVENVNADASVDNNSVDFSATSFSVFAVHSDPNVSAVKIQDMNLQSALGEGYDYGIVANKYSQSGDTETNVMVGSYTSNAVDVGASSNYSNAGGNDYFGSFDDNINLVRFHQSPANVYLGNKAWTQYESKTVKLEEINGSNIEQKSIDVSKVINDINTNFAKYIPVELPNEIKTLENGKDSNQQPCDLILDFTTLDAGTYLVNFSGTQISYGDASKNLNIKKNDDQTIVFYCTTSGELDINDYEVNGISMNTYVTNTREEADNIMQQIIFYAPNATKLNIKKETSGIFIAPKAEFTKIGTSGGVLVCDNYTGGNGEWHYHNHNLPAPDEAGFKLNAKKNFEGGTLSGNDFSFSLYKADKNFKIINVSPIQTKQNESSGDIQFANITYNQEGTYYYVLKENNTGKPNVKYDSTEYHITVKVNFDSASNKYVVDSSSITDANDKSFKIPVFKNTYNMSKSADANLQVEKKLTGRNAQAGEFAFELSVDTGEGKAKQEEVAGYPMPDGIRNGTKEITSPALTDGTVSTALTFGKITYTKAGTYYYKIKEKNTGKSGVHYDEATYDATVTVFDDQNGQLKANVVYNTDKNVIPTFSNTYKAKETSVTFSGTKTLSGRTLKNNEFNFDLKDSDGTVLQTVTNASDGKIEFKPIKYRSAGTYRYTISEEAAQESGITTDSTVYDVTVKVTDDGSGQLKASVEGLNADGSGADFENRYTKSASVTLGGLKTVEGIENSDKAFSFTLSEGDKILQTVTRAGAGEYRFESLTYDKAGEHTYTVAEKKGTADGYTYDEKIYTVKVNVTDDGNGQLKAEISGDTKTGTDLNFTNTYEAQAASAVISGTKTLNGVKASVAGQFRFDLFDANGNRIDTAANDENGNFIFGKLHFEKAGDYTYTIKEQNAGRTIQGIKYQAEAQNVTIHVGDDGDGVLKADVVNGSISFNNTQYGSIKISKDWDDKGNESYRPSSVVIDLIDTATGAVVKKLELSEVNGWSMSYDQLEAGKSYTVHEEENDEFYKALNNDQVVTADVNGTLVNLTNKFIHKPVTVYANKVLNGGTLTNGEFMFALYRNSDPEKVYRTAANNAAGEIFFTDVEYDEKGYTVREIQGSDASVAYDSDAIEYDAEGNVTSSSHAVLTNTVRPIVLRVQKRSRTAPYDPLPGATYGLYEVVKGGNDILIESQVSDENGYMYFGKIQPSTDGNAHIYYFKEIAAPEGHEVDPYIGQKFQVRYTGNGEIALFSEDGQTPVTIGDITSQNAENLLVQHTSAKTTLDTAGALTYSDSKITATAQAADGAFEAGTTMKVEPLTGSELKDAQNKVEIACGKIASNVVYYNVEFVDKNGKVVEPKFGDVTVTIQYKDSLALPEGTDAKSLKIVHLKEKSDGTEVQAVAGSIAANSDKLLQASFTSDSFSKFGIVEPSADNSSLNSNYLVTAAGVSDQVSRLNIAKLDTSGKYLKGARLQIIEKATGRVMADWTTTDGPETFARWFDKAQTKSMNVDTYYILHEVSAPDGYQLADDILFRINKYDSSITIYKLDENGNLVADQEAIDKWVSDNTLDMIDVPVEYQTKKTRMQKTVKYEKVIQGKDKVVYVTNAKAVKTGDVSNLAMYILLFAAAGAVLIVLYFRRRDQRAHKS